MWEVLNGVPYKEPTKTITTPTITAPTYTAPDLKSITSSIASDAATAATKAATKTAADTMKASKIATGTEIKPVGTGYGVAASAQQPDLSMIEKLLQRLDKNTSGSIYNDIRIDGNKVGSAAYGYNEELAASQGIG